MRLVVIAALDRERAAQLSSSSRWMRSTAWAKRSMLATALGLKPTWAWKRWMVLRLHSRSRLSPPIDCVRRGLPAGS